ncbi:hypothetical protein TNCV_405201 [Trichonephila clavipes]|nr:hypothetical protein TNCV_405201 [Trichonephila clavipes]
MLIPEVWSLCPICSVILLWLLSLNSRLTYRLWNIAHTREKRTAVNTIEINYRSLDGPVPFNPRTGTSPRPGDWDRQLNFYPFFTFVVVAISTRWCQIKAKEIQRGKGLDERLPLAVSLSTVHLAPRVRYLDHLATAASNLTRGLATREIYGAMYPNLFITADWSPYGNFSATI